MVYISVIVLVRYKLATTSHNLVPMLNFSTKLYVILFINCTQQNYFGIKYPIRVNKYTEQIVNGIYGFYLDLLYISLNHANFLMQNTEVYKLFCRK